MSEIRFTVMGNAVPQARPRVFVDKKTGRSRAVTPASTKVWRQWVGLAALAHQPGALWDGPIRLEIDFYMQRPKSTPKRVVYPATKPDFDNLVKCVIDSLEGLIYTNDSRIVQASICKHYGDPPRVEVVLTQMDGTP